jgi:hypothetical protein
MQVGGAGEPGGCGKDGDRDQGGGAGDVVVDTTTPGSAFRRGRAARNYHF